jgi:catechol 2,3-dioxygenase-like lactoylglutathione lyase family enzyme
MRMRFLPQSGSLDRLFFDKALYSLLGSVQCCRESSTPPLRGGAFMSDIIGIAHFSIPVSDVKRSREFYCDVVGCKHLFSTPKGHMSFIDAGGTCLILVKQATPVNPVLQGSEGVHNSFTIAPDQFQGAVERLKAKGVELIGEEDRQGGIVNGPRVYFRDPDGTVLEFINLTSYVSGT